MHFYITFIILTFSPCGESVSLLIKNHTVTWDSSVILKDVDNNTMNNLGEWAAYLVNTTVCPNTNVTLCMINPHLLPNKTDNRTNTTRISQCLNMTTFICNTTLQITNITNETHTDYMLTRYRNCTNGDHSNENTEPEYTQFHLEFTMTTLPPTTVLLTTTMETTTSEYTATSTPLALELSESFYMASIGIPAMIFVGGGLLFGLCYYAYIQGWCSCRTRTTSSAHTERLLS
ncbi:membrane protein RL11F [macacine betaherpesvirus 3]|uniref:Rh12 n=1 Tax=Rhesus cytomegalovirus (strain 68-1) TaxID=47929 RepID=Q7TFW9_RHCM6|nr:rh12 [macacine betaherpesvirus 3]AAP50539.1 rh12 [macacine betaherpesvirus 3]QMS44120.1 Rh12 [synthetic construct]QQL10514.1 Rh12 [Rhesus cytomegalovirus strain 68-1.2]QQL10696.1 Rh12 [Rhesus cytomegalovirus strain 68-1_FL]AFL03447.1 Rh12 [macacine betaherpesvirus 3]